MLNFTFDVTTTAQLPGDSSARASANSAIRCSPGPAQGCTAARTDPFLKRSSDLIRSQRGAMPQRGICAGFLGTKVLPGMDPHATCYGGQFGNWAGQLGDGRAINLGEITAAQGHLMLQLKGVGPTPFPQRRRLVLRSSLREYLCSEAMFHGIPTTRALSLIGTGEDVMRDILYDGNPASEPGAAVCRVSVSFGAWPLSNACRAPETELLAIHRLRH